MIDKILFKFYKIDNNFFSCEEIDYISKSIECSYQFGIVNHNIIAIIGLPINNKDYNLSLIKNYFKNFIPADIDIETNNNHFITYTYNDAYYNNTKLVEIINEVLSMREINKHNNLELKKKN